MTALPDPSPDPATVSRSAQIDVRIRLDSPSPPTGEVTVRGEGDPQPFVGWLDLLRVLSQLFDEHDRSIRDGPGRTR